MTTQTPTRGTAGPEQSADNLFNDVKTTANAIEQGDWLQAGLGITNVAMDIIGLGGDPLGAISSAGFGWIIQNISFLREPFDALLGDPTSIASSARGWMGACDQLTTTAGQYGETSTQETGNWSGAAADAYRATSAQQAKGLEALAQASKGVAQAINGAAKVLAEVRKAVLDIINQACNKIIMIIIEALAEAWATFGASIAKAIVQSVQTAVQAAQKMLGKIQKLISTLQKIIQLVQKILQLAQSIKQLLQVIGGKAGGDGTRQPSTAPQNLGYAGTISQGTGPSGTSGTVDRRPIDPGPGYRTPGGPGGSGGASQLPPGIPSWGPSGPPPDPGYPASRVDQARWIGSAVQILVEHGVDPSKIDAGRIAEIVNQNSGGNPHAVNFDDPNARNGVPPKGLMQVTDPVFQQHQLPGYDDIWQPVDNLIAGLRNLLSQFSSLTAAMGAPADR